MRRYIAIHLTVGFSMDSTAVSALLFQSEHDDLADTEDDAVRGAVAQALNVPYDAHDHHQAFYIFPAKSGTSAADPIPTVTLP